MRNTILLHWVGHFNMCMTKYGHMGTKGLTHSSKCHFVKACCLTDTLRISFFSCYGSLSPTWSEITVSCLSLCQSVIFLCAWKLPLSSMLLYDLVSLHSTGTLTHWYNLHACNMVSVCSKCDKGKVTGEQCFYF